MIKRQNDRLLRLLLLGVAALLIIAGIFAFSDCGGKDDWVIGEGGDSSDSNQGSLLNGVFAAPSFKSGRYKMISSAINAEDYHDGAGSTLYSYSSSTKYEYLLDLTADSDGIECRYTFAGIYGSTNDNGTTAVELNTADPEAYNDALAPFYDLIGKSFTVTANADCTDVVISGIDELLAEVPGAANLIDGDTMLSMAKDIFYQMPSTFTDGTEWKVNSYGLNNVYSVKKLDRGYFNISITGDQPTLPADTTDGNGFVTSYDSSSPLSGTLIVDQNNRAVQELSTYQRYNGSISDDSGYGYFFTITASTSCSVTPAE